MAVRQSRTRNSLDARDDAVLQPHRQEAASKDIVHVAADNSIDHDHPAADEVVAAEFDSGNNPLQLHPGVYHGVVDFGFGDHQQLVTKKAVAVVDNFVVDCCIADVAVAVGIAGVAADVLVVVLHKVISGESGIFGSLKPCWAMIIPVFVTIVEYQFGQDRSHG